MNEKNKPMEPVPHWEATKATQIDFVAEARAMVLFEDLLDSLPDTALRNPSSRSHVVEPALFAIVRAHRHVNKGLMFLRLEMLYDKRGDELRRDFCASFGPLCWSVVEERWFSRFTDWVRDEDD